MTYLSSQTQNQNSEEDIKYQNYSIYAFGAMSSCFIFILVFLYGLQMQFMNREEIISLPNDYECMICMEKKAELFVKPNDCPCNKPSSHESCLSEWFNRSRSDKCPFCNTQIKNFETDPINFKYYCLEQDVGRFEIIII